MLLRIVTYACVLLSLVVASCLAAPRGVQPVEKNAATGPSEREKPSEGSEEILPRVRREGQPSNYWWLPGSRPGQNAYFNHISCGYPGRPQFGSSLFESISAGSLVVHSCDPGYKLVGAKLRLCQSNGRWTPALPRCYLVDCGDPGAPIYGSKWVGSTSLDSIVKYMCDPGFRLVGESFRVCRSNGAWSGKLPTCKRIGCPKLQPPVNGKVTVNLGGPGSVTTARYTCDSGFELVGKETRVCEQDGVWQGSAPICKAIDCGHLSAPENGRVTFEATTFGSVAYYECDAGFSLVGEDTRTCQSSGVWSGREPSCKALECDQLPDISNGRVIITSLAVGSTARYVCDPRFQLVGRATRTCQADGKWSGEEPFCRVVNCDNLSAPANGGVELSGTSVGSTAAYYCEDGFQLDGDSIRTCQSSGEWSGEEPFCKPLDCKSLPPPDNGQVSLSGTSVGSTATYSCQPGFALVGNLVRTCGVNGFWSGREPICQPIGCNPLPDPQNGRVSLTGTSPSSTATYTCDPGFSLVGSKTRTCLLSGDWSGSAPFCHAITCPSLIAPANGRVNFPSTTVGSEATYVCNPGFVLKGAESRFCMTNGRWSGAAPTCARAHCSFLQHPKNGDISFSQGTFFGSEATYSCDPSFILEGNPTRVCQANGEWSGVAPVCQRAHCDFLQPPKNGDISFSQGTFFGSEATYSCDPSFILDGNPTRVCQANGEWSGVAPVCQPSGCAPLPEPANGQVTISGTSVGSTASYSCNKGFQLEGGVTRICQLDGTWSGEEPFCRVVDCGPLPAPRNGRISLTDTSFDSTATYSCFQGFSLVGSRTRTCQENGVWSGSEPVCTSLQCPDLPDPQNGRVSLSGTTFGSTATYRCDVGFGLVGTSVHLCQADGTWSEREPTCEISNCGGLEPPANGNIETTGTKFWDTATYSCYPGYSLVGEAARTCEASGFWSGTAPFCSPLECAILEPPKDGKVFFTSISFRAVAKYECIPGFELLGDEERICLEDGQWSGTDPICGPVSCNLLLPPENGDISFSQGTFFGSVATYSCNPPYLLEGSPTRVCKSDREWSGVEPVCQTLECPVLDPPGNGDVDLTGTLVGSTATYSCDDGFALVGSEVRICQNNGFWTGVMPLCQSSSCPDLKVPDNGDISLTGTTIGSTATYTCEAGFSLEGDEVHTCLNSGVWSGEEPICLSVLCEPLSDPENGEVQLTGRGFGDQATYTCNHGFVLFGKGIRDCHDDGKWNGKAPACQIIDCGPLSFPDNGEVTFTGTTFGLTASYLCNPGYVLIGFSQRVCQISREWAGDEPFCRAADCVELLDPENGRVTLTGTDLGDTATYICDIGFRLSHGSETRVCGVGGQWSGTEPVCNSVDCDDLPAPDNGRLIFSAGTTFGSIVTYSCNPGYKLVGLETRTCLEDKTWTGTAPTCEIVDCGQLSPPQYGQVVLSGTTFGSEATYSCQSGFTLLGVEVRVCQAEGIWSGEEPSCSPEDDLSCGPLSSPANGRVNVTGTSLGSLAIYSCNRGFQLARGNEFRRCLDRIGWEGTAPSCEPLECGVLSSPLNGRVMMVGNTVGSIAVYQCIEGYLLLGSMIRTCMPNTDWSGEEPICSALECVRLPNPSNGQVSLTGVELGSVARYSCFEEFSLAGEASRTCQSDGVWSGDAPTCERTAPIDCGDPGTPEDGVKLGDDFRIGATAYYECDGGFELVGPASRVCQPDGLWSGFLPTCQQEGGGPTRPTECGDPGTPDDGVRRGDNFRIGASVHYECNDGFELVGPASRVCRPDGLWSGFLPTCQRAVTRPPRDCGDPGTPDNSVKIGDDYRIGATVYYECDDGFELVGPGSRVCQPDGIWSGFLPTCQRAAGKCHVGNGDTVQDACGRRCKCQNGEFVECCRVRSDFASLDINERRRYINAVLRAATALEFKPRYDALIAKYQDSFDTLAQDTDPSISQFFPWHRYFLLEYENLLREIDCRITIPYWDWTALPMNPYMSPVWNSDSGFGDSSRSNDSCVNNGPFRFDVFQVTPSAEGGCLRRQYRLQMFPTRAIVEQDLLPLPTSEFTHFHQFLQVFLHTNVRCFVGGQMCTPDAANDPAYILHIAQNDALLTRWQDIDEEHLHVQYSTDARDLALAGDLTVSQFSNNQDLPNDVRVCYNPSDFQSHIPENMRFLSPALRQMTDNHNLHMECIGHEEMEGIGMTNGAEEFMDKMCDHE